MAEETAERLVNVTIMSTESDILQSAWNRLYWHYQRLCCSNRGRLWHLNLDCAGRYNHGDI